jgi:hypothetical protein
LVLVALLITVVGQHHLVQFLLAAVVKVLVVIIPTVVLVLLAVLQVVHLHLVLHYLAQVSLFTLAVMVLIIL